MKRKLHLWLGCLGLMLATMLVAAAGAVADTTDKPYKVVLPETVSVGPDETITVTYTNLAKPQTMGSANLTAPVGYKLNSVTTTHGRATISGSTLQLRNLDLAPNKSVTATLKADVDCQATGSTWRSEVKQANDFNGVGNEFFFAGGNLTTRADGRCRTVETCPEDVFCEEFITYRGTFTYTPTSAETMLRAFATTAEEKTIDYFLTLASKAFATRGVPDAGELDLEFDPSISLDCAGNRYIEAAPVTAIATGPLNRTKSVSLIIDQQLMSGVYDREASELEMCFAAPQPFATDVTYGALETTTVRGATWFKGILPDCVGNETPAPEPNTSDLAQPVPCVYERKADGAGNGIISVEIPFNYADPTYRG